MKIIETGIFRSSDFYSTEISPRRRVGRYELELYIGGEGFSVIGEVKYPHAGCHFLLAKPGDMRFSIGRFECRYVHFLSDEPELDEIPRLIVTNPENDIVSAMRRLCELHGLKQLAGLCELLDRLCDDKPTGIPPRPPENERYIGEVIKTKEYMEQNYGSKITLADLSGMVYMSKNFYRTVFTRVMEMSPSRYLKSIRVAKAIEYIREGKLGLGEIAGLCGFENQSYMNYVLKQETGRTPTELSL